MATSVVIELIVETPMPQRGVGGITVGAFGLDPSKSSMRHGLINHKTCTGNIGGPGIWHIDTQGELLVCSGIDGGEGLKLIHDGSEW